MLDIKTEAPWTLDFAPDVPKPPRIPNGKFTFINPKGEHRTFKIKTQKDDANFAPGKRIVSLLVGPHNDSWRDYKGFGFVDDAGVHLWKSFSTQLSYQWFRQLINVLIGGLPCTTESKHFEGYRVEMSKLCVVCNADLTTPESIRLGIGPVCAKGGRD